MLPDGDLDFDRLLGDFVAFWRANAESFLRRQPYSEAAAQLVFMGFLQKILNGGPVVPGGSPSIDREFAVGSRRVDLLIRWPLPSGQVRRWAIELKVRYRTRDADPLTEGLEQLTDYLKRLGLGEGRLMIFDQRPDAPPLPERISLSEMEHQGRRFVVLRL